MVQLFVCDGEGWRERERKGERGSERERGKRENDLVKENSGVV